VTADLQWTTLDWHTLVSSADGDRPDGRDVLDDLVALARRCLVADGGMPLGADERFLRGRYLGDDSTTSAVRLTDGTLVGASAVRPSAGDGERRGATVTAMVDPRLRGLGLGARLLDEALAATDRRDGPVSVETESLTPAAAELFASRGLRQVFAEDVMRFDLAAGAVPSPVWPDGTTVAAWSDATSARFHAAYSASFCDRPGFPGWSAEQWIAWAVDEDFRPGWSMLATVPDLGDAGFVTCADGWIIQVGVVPAARGRGLGAALVGEALARMAADGAGEALLDVNVDNPAGGLYRRLGFTVLGRRARFQR
jgi:mycothiol synthase